jgi:hypothetical protein
MTTISHTHRACSRNFQGGGGYGLEKVLYAAKRRATSRLHSFGPKHWRPNERTTEDELVSSCNALLHLEGGDTKSAKRRSLPLNKVASAALKRR